MASSATERPTTRISLTTAALLNRSERSLRSLYRNAALAVGTPSSLSAESPRRDWSVDAAGRDSAAALVISDSPPGRSAARDPVELLAGPAESGFKATPSLLERPESLTVSFDSGLVWWAGTSADTVIAVVAADGEVHRLSAPSDRSVHSEPLREGDRMVALSGSIASVIESLDGLLEMALIDNPSAASSCLWLLDAADDAGASEPMFSAVWGHSDGRTSLR